MGIGDIFKAKENEQLKQRIAYLESIMTPEMREITSTHDEIERIKAELLEKTTSLNNLNMQIATAERQLYDTDRPSARGGISDSRYERGRSSSGIWSV